MSVLIKGMEMPKGCIACPFMFFGRDDCLVWCKWLDEPSGEWSNRGGKWRHPDCPLIEVPTPHGPLIDADEIIEVQMLDEMYEEWTLKTMSVAEYLAFAADTPPTIIEAEEGEEE